MRSFGRGQVVSFGVKLRHVEVPSRDLDFGSGHCAKQDSVQKCLLAFAPTAGITICIRANPANVE
jgi:hypothetical protein